MKLNTISLVFAVVSGVGIACMPTSAPAQQLRTITVVGAGKASASPTHVLLRGRIEGQGETSNEAYEAFRAERTKIGEKLTDSEDGKTRVLYEGEKLMTPGAMMEAGIAAFPGDGGAAAGAAKAYLVMESVVFKVAIENGMEREQITGPLTKLLDKAARAGVKFTLANHEMAMSFGIYGSNLPGLAEFTIDDPTRLRHDAYEAAVKDARARADRLASLTDVKVGRVVSIEELTLSGEGGDETQALMQMYTGQASTQPASFSSDQNRGITVEQKLKIVYELVD